VRPALEVLDAHVELAGRTIVDTISDNAALGAMVLGGRFAPDAVDLRWVGALLARNGEIEESGVSGAVLGHPATGVAWLADRLAGHGDRLAAGEIVLAGSFTPPDVGAARRPRRVRLPRPRRGDLPVSADLPEPQQDLAGPDGVGGGQAGALRRTRR
jgi:2-keto-4-pentenoate hydratase